LTALSIPVLVVREDRRQARALLQRALTLCHDLGDHDFGFDLLAVIEDNALYENPIDPLERAYRMEEILNHCRKWRISAHLWPLQRLTRLYLKHGRADRAHRLIRENLVVPVDTLSINWCHIWCLFRLAELAQQNGDLYGARRHHSEALRLTREAPDGVRVACL